MSSTARHQLFGATATVDPDSGGGEGGTKGLFASSARAHDAERLPTTIPMPQNQRGQRMWRVGRSSSGEYCRVGPSAIQYISIIKINKTFPCLSCFFFFEKNVHVFSCKNYMVAPATLSCHHFPQEEILEHVWYLEESSGCQDKSEVSCLSQLIYQPKTQMKSEHVRLSVFPRLWWTQIFFFFEGMLNVRKTLKN